MQYKPAGKEVVNFAYRYERFRYVQPDPDRPGVAPYWPGFDQVEARGLADPHAWNVFVRDVYALQDHDQTDWSALPASSTAPAAGGCASGVRRYVSSRTGSPDTGIWLQLELAGLAGVGSASDTFLDDGDPGLRPTMPGRLSATGAQRS